MVQAYVMKKLGESRHLGASGCIASAAQAWADAGFSSQRAEALQISGSDSRLARCSSRSFTHVEANLFSAFFRICSAGEFRLRAARKARTQKGYARAVHVPG